MCSPPHPHDSEGFDSLEVISLGLYPEEAPLLFRSHRDRVKDRVVAELGVGQLRGRIRAVGAVAWVTRTAAPTERMTVLSMVQNKCYDGQQKAVRKKTSR